MHRTIPLPRYYTVSTGRLTTIIPAHSHREAAQKAIAKASHADLGILVLVSSDRNQIYFSTKALQE